MSSEDFTDDPDFVRKQLTFTVFDCLFFGLQRLKYQVVSLMSFSSFSFSLKIVGGTNLIVYVPVKAKKPTLYATALMTHLFSDEEMREGCVEPREGNSSKKTTLDQTRINVIKSKSLS